MKTFDSLGNDFTQYSLYGMIQVTKITQEQFLTVSECGVCKSNHLVHFKKGTVGGIKTELYPLDNVTRVNVVYPIQQQSVMILLAWN